MAILNSDADANKHARAVVFKRRAGCVLHITALPGDGPVGDLTGAIAFASWMHERGLTVWQILPTGPCHDGPSPSPYSSWSDLSGNPWLIGLQPLRDAGLIHQDTPKSTINGRVDFHTTQTTKMDLLCSAAQRFFNDPNHEWKPDYNAFMKRADWAIEAGLFWALRNHHNNLPWWQWPSDLANRTAQALAHAQDTHREKINIWTVLEFFFDRQYQTLRRHCDRLGVRLLGDLPIYVGKDSVDVWANQSIFQTSTNGQFNEFGGVPPDAYSPQGQNWGNPTYHWPTHAQTNYAWWTRRIQRSLSLTHTLRIDHFIGLVRYWAIPAHCKTGEVGRWVEGPGQQLFDALQQHLGQLPLVVEDLGPVDNQTRALQQHLGFPGMRVIQYGFGPDSGEEHQPNHHPKQSISYTSTHDTDTVMGWWNGLDETTQQQLAIPQGKTDIASELISMTLDSKADWAIVPIQDWLGLGTQARFNVPGTTSGNWLWRVTFKQLNDIRTAPVRDVLIQTNRMQPPKVGSP